VRLPVARRTAAAGTTTAKAASAAVILIVVAVHQSHRQQEFMAAVLAAPRALVVNSLVGLYLIATAIRAAPRAAVAVEFETKEAKDDCKDCAGDHFVRAEKTLIGARLAATKARDHGVRALQDAALKIAISKFRQDVIVEDFSGYLVHRAAIAAA